MKKSSLLTAVFFLLTLLPFSPAIAQHPTLYINFVSHNEPGDLLHQAIKFNKSKAFVLQLAGIIETKQAAWNLETCDGFVTGALNFEGASSNTLKTVVSGTTGDYIEIDPRNKNITNIADLVYLLDSAGANPTQTLGGFICNSTDTAMPPDWFQYQDTITGITYPSSKWKCELMWGAGSIAPHTNDVNDYGIWKPDTVDLFHDHNPARSVWYIGNGCQPLYSLDSTEDEQVIIDLIQGVVDSLQNDLWPQDKFYNLSITIDQNQFGPMLFGKITTLVDSVNALGTAIAWRKLTDKYAAFQTWTASHTAYSQWDCGEIVSGIADGVLNSPVKLFPNPCPDACTLSVTDGREHYVVLLDPKGKKIMEASFHDGMMLDLRLCPAGLYLVVMDGRVVGRIVRE